MRSLDPEDVALRVASVDLVVEGGFEYREVAGSGVECEIWVRDADVGAGQVACHSCSWICKKVAQGFRLRFKAGKCLFVTWTGFCEALGS